MKKTKSLLALSGFLLAGLAACGTTSSPASSSSESVDSVVSEHTHNYVAHAEVPATCVKEGTGAYYSCSGCDKLFDGEKKVISAVPVLAKDPSNHAKMPSLVYDGDYKKNYVVGESFSLGDAVYKIKCDECAGLALTNDQAKLVTYVYPTAEAVKFTAEDVGKADLKITAKYSSYSVDLPISVSKRSTTIDDIADMKEHCGFAAFKAIEGVSSTEGEIVYTFAEAKDGTYLGADEFNGAHPDGMTVGSDGDSKVYYAKASVEGSGEYESASKEFTITITHREDLSWDENADKTCDIYGCPDQTPVSFKKTVDAANQDILLNDNGEAKFSISLAGVDAYESIKSIKFGDYDLGTDVDDLSISDALKTDYAKHGKGTIVVTVHSAAISGAPEADHIINVPVTFITKQIASKEDFNTYVQPTSDNLTVNGYYRQTAATISPDRSALTGWADAFVGTYDGGGNEIKFNSNAWGAGLFGNNLGSSETSTVIKNLKISDGWHSSGADNVLLAKAIWNTTFDNVTFALAGSSYIKQEWNSGWITSQRMQGASYKNCTFNAQTAALSAVFGGHQNNFKDITFEDSVLNVKSYMCLWHNEPATFSEDIATKVMTADGLTINLTAA